MRRSTLASVRIGRRGLFRSSALSALAAASALVTGQAHAQDANPPADAASPSQVEEIVVTAQRREERLQDTPVAVTAFTSKALQDRGVTNLIQLTQFTPSLNIQPTNRGGGGGSSVATFIRGVGTGDYNIPTDPAIGLYVDGVYLARSVGGLLSLPDIERIEVLKGPQGTLYGRNTLGGAISVVTEQPHLSGPAEGMGQVRIGSYGRLDLTGSINAPLAEDKTGAKLSLSWLSSNGWGHDAYTGQRLNDEGRFIARGALRFEASPDLQLTLNADYTRQRQNPPVASLGAVFASSPLVSLYNAFVAPGVSTSLGLPAGSVFDSRFVTTSRFVNNAGSPLQDDFDNGGVSATLVWSRSPALEVKSITAARTLSADIKVDADGTPYTLIGEQTRFHDTQLSQEIDLGGKLLDDRLTYVAGIYLFREVGRTADQLQVFDGLYQALNNPKLALNSDTHQHLDARSYAAFAQASYAITQTLNLTLGGRINYDEKRYDAFVLSPQLNTIAIADQASAPHWTSFTPKAGLDWKPADNVMLYASYAEGFKSGGVSPPIVGTPLLTYDPERLRSYEVGAKTEWFDRRLIVNTAAYYSTYRDIQLTGLVTLPSGAVGKPVQNGGAADIWGLEAELIAAPVGGLTFNLSGAYTHGRLTEVSPGVAANLGAFVGERLPDIPDYNISAGVQYVMPTLAGDFTVRLDSAFTGKAQLTIGDPLSYQRPYGLLNARIAFAPKAVSGMEIALEGTNLTDKLYFTYDQVVAAGQFQLFEPAAPRQIFLTARYKF